MKEPQEGICSSLFLKNNSLSPAGASRHKLRGLKLFVLPPHSPKLNGRVERVHRTHLEEFYAVIPESSHLEKSNIALYKWERVYNQSRPHQALDYLTPAENIGKYHPGVILKKFHMY